MGEWLVDLLDKTNEVRNATREEVSEWAAAVFWELVGSRILLNSWRKTGFNWFPGVVDQDDIVDSVIGIGGINFPDIMAQLAKMQDHWSKIKLVMAKRSTYVDATYYRKFLMYRISTTSSI